MSTSKVFSISIIWCFLTLPNQTIWGQSITNLQPAQVPKASSEDIFRFEHIRRSQNGISGDYDTDLYLGSAINSNGRVFLGKKWFLWSNQPETFCGELETFGSRREKLFALLERGQEMDWVLRMKPGIGFEHLIAHTYYKNLLSAEVTPHESLLENPWFEFDAKKSSLLNSNVCACGVYARDKEHDKYGPKMEIHPTHMIWWKDSTTLDSESYQMIAIQDNSNRFNRGYFRPGMGKNLKSKVKSWVASPLTARFKIAFLIPATSQSTADIQVRLKSQYQQGINALKNSPGNVSSFELHYAGKRILQVLNDESSKQLAVQFSDVFLREDGSLQGFIELTTSIGESGHYGDYHIFSATTDNPLIQNITPTQACFEENYFFWIKKEQVNALAVLINETGNALLTARGKVKKVLQKQQFLLQEKRKLMIDEGKAAEDKLLECIEQ
jgi:hypothetical protein